MALAAPADIWAGPVATHFTISDVDYAPADLYDQTPVAARLLRRVPGTDRPDYWLAMLEKPLEWEQSPGVRQEVTHLIVCSRYQGTTISESMTDLVIGIAYVTDESLLEDEKLDFAKCRYVAIGLANTRHDP